MKRKVFAVSIVLALVIAAIAVVKSKQQQIAHLPRPQPPAPSVQVSTISQGSIEVTSHYLASIEPLTKTDLAARISGNVLSINKREGDQVRQGEVVAMIDDRELVDHAVAVNAEVMATRQRLAGAQSAYATQKSIYGRDDALYRAGAISKEALERSRSAMDGAKAAVDSYEESLKGLGMNTKVARTQAGYARISAPFSGVISKRWMEPGDLAAPGKPILTLEKTSSYKVLAQVPQEELIGIRPGTKVVLSNGGQSLAAKVNRVYPSLGKSMLATVEVLTPSSPFGLPSSSTVGFDVVTKKVEGLIVPEQAVVKGVQGHVVYLVKNGGVKVVPVQLAGSGNGKAAITCELSPGDQVAVAQENKLLTLTDGCRVTVARDSAPASPPPPASMSSSGGKGVKP